jgi:hypothetical protein
MWSNSRTLISSTAAFTRSVLRTADVKMPSVRMTRWPLIAAEGLVALVSVAVSDRGDHPSQARQNHASRHPPITGVTLTGVGTRAPGKRHGCTRV